MSNLNKPAQTDAADVGLWERQPDGLLVLVARFPDEDAVWRYLSDHHDGESWGRVHFGTDADVPLVPPQLPFCVAGFVKIIMEHRDLVRANAAVYRACIAATDFAGSVGDRSPAIIELSKKRAQAARLLVACYDSLAVVAEMVGSRDPGDHALIHNRPLLPLVTMARAEADPTQAEPDEPTAVTLAVRFLAGVAESMNGEFPLLQR
jgi:hypothetical protein